ncbi:G2/mitotic-specific cyclin-B2 [Halotydeus destructor]|nr:G2/mitotic-specific cyclin-B2 [Halotydeus destructor]
MSQRTGLATNRGTSNLLNLENRPGKPLASRGVAPANQLKRLPVGVNTRRFGTLKDQNKVAPSQAANNVKKQITVTHVRNDGENAVPQKVDALRKKSLACSKIPTRTGRPSILDKPVQQVLSGFSSNLLPPNVENIDKDDGSNVLLATDYVNDIYGYLRQLEVEQSLKVNFLAIQREMSPKMRSVLVDWLINVHHQFRLLPETLYMGISIMDRFLPESISKDKIQLVGVTAFLIASKFEEIYPPDLMDFVTICDQLYSKREIIKMEMVMLRVLKFELGRPLPLHFLRRNSKAAHADPKIHAMAKYIMEVTLLDHECSAWKPSLLAAAALYVTLKVLGNDPDCVWSKTVAYYSNYDEEQLLPYVAKVAHFLRKVENSRFQNCCKKYASSKLQEISKSPELQSPVIDELAANYSP